jgi:hypothetical protein
VPVMHPRRCSPWVLGCCLCKGMAMSMYMPGHMDMHMAAQGAQMGPMQGVLTVQQQRQRATHSNTTAECRGMHLWMSGVLALPTMVWVGGEIAAVSSSMVCFTGTSKRHGCVWSPSTLAAEGLMFCLALLSVGHLFDHCFLAGWAVPEDDSVSTVAGWFCSKGPCFCLVSLQHRTQYIAVEIIVCSNVIP